MQVIVCDDDIENLNEMIQVCYDVLAKGTEVRGFSDASMLAEALQAGMVQPALLLLDIEMPALTGLELREQMASKLRMTDIIYVTSHEEMMEAAFGRNVIAFVRKVGNWDRLSEVLHNFQQEHQCMVDVTWKKKVWQIDVSQILYIQSADNYSRVVFYLQGELVQALQSYTMKEWERIQFTYQGRLPQELGVEDLDLCFLLSNILENAKEAVEKIPLDIGERKIHLTIGTYKNLVFLDCINTILPEEELSAETDKDSEWHGFGIHNIRKIVQKYDGEFELSFDRQTATAHAVLHKNL